jgi:8-oxo-dGTP diphosphatase
VTVHVAVGVIINHHGQVLISRRTAAQHQGNKWEFPGGKVEAGETSRQALCREIREELGLDIQSACFLTTITHRYPDKNVQLDVYEVRDWQGEPEALEAQPLQWVEKAELNQYEFPQANSVILDLLRQA